MFGKLANIFKTIIGVGGNYFKNRAEYKRLLAEQKHEIIKAQTKAQVDRILSNTDSDNQIDLITAQNKRHTFKDEVVTYLFLVPVFIATIVPFVISYQNNDWVSLSNHVKDSYENLDLLPVWYKYVLGAVIIDVLGFRSFARKIVDIFLKKYTQNILKK